MRLTRTGRPDLGSDGAAAGDEGVVEPEHDDRADDGHQQAVEIDPDTPGWPNWLNRKPPTTAPTMPSRISTTRPRLVPLTTLLPMKPAIRPSTIQARKDIGWLRLDAVRREARGSPTQGKWMVPRPPSDTLPPGSAR